MSAPLILSFGDAVRIARGCHDYSGGHHYDGHYDAYHHGIQTVINVLEAAEKAGLIDTQVAAVWRIGGEVTEQTMHDLLVKPHLIDDPLDLGFPAEAIRP